MQKLSDTITRKFIESIDVSDWEVETENGFVDIISSNKTIEYEVYSIVLENGLEIKCADTHILIDENNNEVFAKDSLGINLKTTLGNSKVIEVTALDYSENMYDLSIDSQDHTYYTNNILSHNTITSAAYILWYTLFQSNKTVAVVANKDENARETLARYQLMYENLPLWMQQGIKTWNKGDIELENGSKVRTSATSAAGLRSKSISLLYVDEAAVIPNNISEQFFASTYPVISSGKTSKIIMTSTPLGYNHFWKFWNDAEHGRNDFVPIHVPYWEVPGRDEKWAEDQRRLLGEVKFNQEVLCIAGDSKIVLKHILIDEPFTITIEEFTKKLKTKINDIFYNFYYEILTPTGFSPFTGIKISHQNSIKFIFHDGSHIETSYKHRFIENNKEIVAETLKVSDIIFNKTIVNIQYNYNTLLYDPLDVAKNNQYIANGLVHHNCHFLGSTNTLIRSDIIAQLSYNPPIYTAEGLDLYEMKDPNHIYTIVVDIAKGVGGDYSAFVIIDVTEVPYRVVGKYRDNTIAPLLFPSVIYRLAKEYNYAYVLCEINSSDQVPHILYEEYEYENLLFIQRDSRGQKVSSGFGGPNMQYGVNTDKKTKRIGCFNFKSLLEEKKLLVFDADIISEISTFVEKRGSYEADDGYHDDLVMTLVLFSWLTTNLYFKELTDVNLRRLMYEKRIKEIEEEMLPVGYMNDGDKVDIQDMVEDGDVWAPFNASESPFKIPESYLTSRL